jgi:pyridinium-3,5-biscarboxylic acid mononucleotide synthase
MITSDDRASGRPTAFEGRLRSLLDEVAAGAVSPEAATEELRRLPFSDLGFAKVDHHRELRQGVCEIVFAGGKTVDQVRAIVESVVEGNDGPVLVTHATPEQIEAVREVASRHGLPVEERTRSRAVAIVRNVPISGGRVIVVTAGTSDLPVAEEAELTARLMGVEVDVQADVGVAGLHRVAAIQDLVRGADAVIVVAGMEGALASVVGGFASCPVIACPTSVGYGASFGGLAALLAMLSSCTPGVVCVNIDDGVGAGYTGALIARRAVRPEGWPG